MNRHPNGPLVIIPAWNEEATVGSVIRSLHACGYDCLVVDDGSRDNTRKVAMEAGAPVLSLPLNVGVGAALRAGFRYAVANGYQAAVQCDADGQHDPRGIAALISGASEQQAHLMIGSRFADGGSYAADVGRVRGLAMRLLARRASKATGAEIHDATSGFRLITEPLLTVFATHYPAQYLGDTFEAIVMAGRGGYRVREIPARMFERQGGQPSSGTLSSIKFMIRTLLAVSVGSTPRIPPCSGPPVALERPPVAADPGS